jgi:hypothetical protein
VGVTPPSNDVPAGLRGLSGTWEGLWGNLPEAGSALIVRSVSASKVEATYVFQGVASPMTFDLAPGSSTLTTTTGGGNVAWKWELAASGSVLNGERTQAEQTVSVAMNRCRQP